MTSSTELHTFLNIFMIWKVCTSLYVCHDYVNSSHEERKDYRSQSALYILLYLLIAGMCWCVQQLEHGDYFVYVRWSLLVPFLFELWEMRLFIKMYPLVLSLIFGLIIAAFIPKAHKVFSVDGMSSLGYVLAQLAIMLWFGALLLRVLFNAV